MFCLMCEEDSCNKVDETAIYICDALIDLVIDKLEKHSFEIVS